MKLKYTFILFTLLVLTSCSIKQPYELYTDYTPNDNSGIIVCSVLSPWEGITLPIPSFYIRKTGTTETIRVFGRDTMGQSALKLKTDIGIGFVKILNLPAGNYEIFDWEQYFNIETGEWIIKPKQNFSAPFTVKPNAINYLGQFYISHGIFYHAHEAERDTNLAKKQQPSLANLPVDIQNIKCVSGCNVEAEKGNESFNFMLAPVK
jgi:hypothetical protein